MSARTTTTPTTPAIPATPRPTPSSGGSHRPRSTSYARQVTGVLLVAFTLSAAHTVYSSVAGIADPTFGVDDPLAWAFYGVAFGVTALAGRPARWSQAVVLAVLAVLLVVSVFVYPTMFGPEQQTVFGWFENDVYVALLVVAAHLSVLRWRRVGIRG